MREITKIPEHRITRLEDGSTTVDVPIVEGVDQSLRFEIDLPFWSRVKVLFGWNPVVEHSVIEGLHVRVGEVRRGWH